MEGVPLTSNIAAPRQARVLLSHPGYVVDRRVLPYEKLPTAQMPLHHPEGPVTLLEELLQLGPSSVRHLDAPHAPQAGPGEVEQEAVLLLIPSFWQTGIPLIFNVGSSS
jgi:hypothetical protein